MMEEEKRESDRSQGKTRGNGRASVERAHYSAL